MNKYAEKQNDVLVLYIHGKGGNPNECKHFRPLFPNCDIFGLDYEANTPWDALEEFSESFDNVTKGYTHTILIANSIGAYFVMNALSDKKIYKAYFISPVVDMEKLICDMMISANVSEKELEEAETIETDFGKTLSWDYLCYVRNHPIKWSIPTWILYGEKDCLTSVETISKFADSVKAKLTVMKDGEHWFHTEAQMNFLDDWVLKTNSQKAVKIKNECNYNLRNKAKKQQYI